MVKLFHKKESRKDKLSRELADLKATYDACDDVKEKEVIFERMNKIDEQITKIDEQNKETATKIIVSVLTFLGVMGPVVTTTVNYNIQYDRERRKMDEVQLGMERSRFGAGNNIMRK